MDEQENKYLALDNWFLTAQGNRVAHAFAAELMPLYEQFSGQNLLQLGSCGDNIWLPLFKFKNKWIVTPSSIPNKSLLISSLNMLPIDRDSIDCILAPFAVEVFAKGKSVIDEIDRVLKPMGYAIFFGINPFSFRGAAFQWGCVRPFNKDNRISLSSSLTLKHALLNRGYRICAYTNIFYIPPIRSSYLIKKLEFLNEMGKMIWPFPAGFYCIIAQKYQYCSPSLKQVIAEPVLVNQKSALQGIGKYIHD